VTEKYKERYLASPQLASRPRTRLQPHWSQINKRAQNRSSGLLRFHWSRPLPSTRRFIDLLHYRFISLSGKDDAAATDSISVRNLVENCASQILRFGCFPLCPNDGSVPMVSNIQAYLDLYARGGRISTSDYLLTNAINPAGRPHDSRAQQTYLLGSSLRSAPGSGKSSLRLAPQAIKFTLQKPREPRISTSSST